MRKDTALKILALKKRIAALGMKELKALVQYKKRRYTEKLTHVSMITEKYRHSEIINTNK